LKKVRDLLTELDPQTKQEFLAAKELIREELRDKLDRLTSFRTKAGDDLGVTFHHTSDKNVWDGHLNLGEKITLVPGMHNRWGTGVYFSEKDLFKEYQKRRQTDDDKRAEKPVTFMLPAFDIIDLDDFRRYDDPKQGKGAHSSKGLIHVTIEAVQKDDNRKVVTGNAAR